MKTGNKNTALLKDYCNKLNDKWPTKNTAFLIVHGIGNQKPIETLDSFSRGIISALKNIPMKNHLMRFN